MTVLLVNLPRYCLPMGDVVLPLDMGDDDHWWLIMNAWANNRIRIRGD